MTVQEKQTFVELAKTGRMGAQGATPESFWKQHPEILSFKAINPENCRRGKPLLRRDPRTPGVRAALKAVSGGTLVNALRETGPNTFSGNALVPCRWSRLEGKHVGGEDRGWWQVTLRDAKP